MRNVKIRPAYSDPQDYSPRRHCVVCRDELYGYDGADVHDECLQKLKEINEHGNRRGSEALVRRGNELWDVRV